MTHIMKIGIQISSSFSPRWISYCETNKIDYKIVDAYANDIISQLADCDIFMWHFSQNRYEDAIFAKQLIFALEQSGKKVFPNSRTCWSFDDKVGQKYLLESIGAPLVPTYIFYHKSDAYKWISETTFPKVFKLRVGASSQNVRLVQSSYEAKKLVRKSFCSGFSVYPKFDSLKERIRKWLIGKTTTQDVLKGLSRLFYAPEYSRLHSKEIGYVYFQDYLPNNTFDIRVCVVGDKAFALKRLVRKNDFRASGSGDIIYDKNQIDERCVKLAFDTNQKLNAQCIAFDFVYDEKHNPQIIESSFGFDAESYDNCEGYWTSDMSWHPGSNFDFCGWMIEDLINDKNNNI